MGISVVCSAVSSAVFFVVYCSRQQTERKKDMTNVHNPGEKEEKELLSALLELGEEMYLCGAEIHRVEDTLSRIGEAYGAERMNVFAITSTIVVTMNFKDTALTQSRRLRAGGQTDFMKLEDYNSLSRMCCKNLPAPEELKKEIEKIRKRKRAPFDEAFGSFLASGAFAVFFGGTPADGLAASIIGLLIFRMSGLTLLKKPNRIIYQFIASLFTGLIAVFVCSVFPALHADKILIGDIMLLVPGIAITNAFHDMMEGDTMSGILRLTESLLWAAAMAFGFLLPLSIKGALL